MRSLRIGIDLGGTKIEGIALDGGREAARIRVDTPRDDYAATLAAVASLVANLERDAGGQGTVGVGIPGTLSPATGLVKNANSVWLLGRALKHDLEARLGREIRIANDANCFAVSEATDGAAAGAEVVFGVIVGTGTGAGITVGGRVLTGPNGIAGEWGHNPLPWATGDEVPGPHCYCGKNGCVETFLSGPGMTMDHERRSGRREPAPAIVAAAAAGDAIAETTLARYEHRMARALAGVINVLDPDVIVLGGGMSNIERLYQNVPRLWNAFVFDASQPLGAGRSGHLRTRLVRAAHGDASGVRGAAWLWGDDRPETGPSGR
ncbi:MAG TPA: ROK family protein [Vicinamibacterales bacterium]|nr:ROK family protein [Vicinamibacterales bacterium]